MVLKVPRREEGLQSLERPGGTRKHTGQLTAACVHQSLGEEGGLLDLRTSGWPGGGALSLPGVRALGAGSMVSGVRLPGMVLANQAPLDVASK